MCQNASSVLPQDEPSAKRSSVTDEYTFTNGTAVPSAPPPAGVPPRPPPTNITLPPIESIPFSNLSRTHEITSPIQRLSSPTPPSTFKGTQHHASTLPFDRRATNSNEWKYGPHEIHTRKEKVIICTYICSWFICSVASLFMAKHILHTYRVNESIFTLWLFSSSCIFGILFTKVFRLHTLTLLSKQQLKAVIPLSAAFLVKEILKYASLARVSVNLVNTIRSLGPLFAVLMEFAFLNHRPPHRVVLSLTPIIFGVALTSIDEIHAARGGDNSFSVALIGLVCAVASTAINNGQNIYSKILFGRKKIDPVSLQIYLSACSLLLMSPYSITSYINHWRQAHEDKPHFLAPNTQVALALLLAGFINFLASQLAFNTLNRITPLSYSVANTAKRVAIACIAIYGFGEYLSKWNGMGIVMSIVGVFVYERAARGYKEALLYRKAEREGRAMHKRSGSEVINL